MGKSKRKGEFFNTQQPTDVKKQDVSLSDIFCRTHLTGFNVKKKFASKIQDDDPKDTSYLTTFYRKKNEAEEQDFGLTTSSFMNKRGKSFSQSVPSEKMNQPSRTAFSSTTAGRAEITGMKRENKTYLVQNYLQKRIDIRQQLKSYRNDLEEKFPDPEKAPAREDASPSKTGKVEEVKRAPSPDKKKAPVAAAKDDKKKAPPGKKDGTEPAQTSTLSERTDGAKTTPEEPKSEEEN